MNYTLTYEMFYLAVTALSLAFAMTFSFIEKKTGTLSCFLLLAIPKLIQQFSHYFVLNSAGNVPASFGFGLATLFFDFALFFVVFGRCFQKTIILMLLYELAFIPMMLFKSFAETKFVLPDSEELFIPGANELILLMLGFLVAASISVLITKLIDRLLKKINYDTKIFRFIGIAGVICYFTMEIVVLTLDVSNVIKKETVFRYLIVLAIWVSFCVLMYVVNDYFTKKRLRREIDVLNGEIQRQFEYYTLMKERNEEIQKIRHDIKTHLMTVSSFMEADEYDRAKTYLTSLDEQFSRIKRLKFTGNLTADTVISDIKEKCEKESIEFIFSGYLGEKTGIDDISMTCVLTNLLNNAYEACLRVKEDKKFIKIDISSAGGCVAVKCENSKNTVEKPESDNFKSTKDGYSHGYGMRIIKDIVKNYDGVTEINDNGNTFEIKVLLTEK